MSAQTPGCGSNSESRKRMAGSDPHMWPDVARSEAAIKAEAWDEGATYASPYAGAYLRSLLIANPYRDVAGLADRLATDTAAPEGVTSVEAGCTCGGVAACQQCQDRDAAAPETLVAEVRLTEAEREAIGERICWNCHDRNVWALVETIIAARIEQARAGEGALRERMEALADAWQADLDTGGIRDKDARYCWQMAVSELRAALAETDQP